MISLVPDHYSFTENSEAIVLCSSSFGKFSLLDKVPKEQKIHSAPPNAVIQSSRLFFLKKMSSCETLRLLKLRLTYLCCNTFFFIFIATWRWTSKGARFSLRENQRHPQTARWIQRNARQGDRSAEKQIHKGEWKYLSCFAFPLIVCLKLQLLDTVYNNFINVSR